jgi:hypothetical protein
MFVSTLANNSNTLVFIIRYIWESSLFIKVFFLRSLCFQKDWGCIHLTKWALCQRVSHFKGWLWIAQSAMFVFMISVFGDECVYKQFLVVFLNFCRNIWRMKRLYHEKCMKLGFTITRRGGGGGDTPPSVHPVSCSSQQCHETLPSE